MTDELTRLRARLAGRATPPTRAEVLGQVAAHGHPSGRPFALWLVACGYGGAMVVALQGDRGEARLSLLDRSDVHTIPEAVARYEITRWWPLDGETRELTDWPAPREDEADDDE